MCCTELAAIDTIQETNHTLSSYSRGRCMHLFWAFSLVISDDTEWRGGGAPAVYPDAHPHTQDYSP